MTALAKHFAGSGFDRCPVCGAAALAEVGSAETSQHGRSYACGAAFERCEGFFLYLYPCPTPSQVAVNLIIAEARELDHE